MIKMEAVVESIKDYKNSSNAEIKNEIEMKKENIFEKCSLDKTDMMSIENNFTKLKKKNVEVSAFISSETSKLKHSAVHLGVKPHKINIKNNLRKKYKNLTRKNVLRLKSKLINSQSTIQKRELQNVPMDILNVSVSDTSINSSYIASCRFCKKSFVSSTDYNNHVCNQKAKICSQPVHTCMLCSLVFKQKNHLDRHVKGHSRNNCKVCTVQLTTRRALCKHLKDVHNINEPVNLYKCDFCEKAFCKRPLLVSHLKNHAEGKLLCLKCGFMCYIQKDYDNHMKKHKTPIKFECLLCNKQFVRRQQFNQHMMGHEQFLCLSCDVTFSTKKLLIQHQQTHHGLSIVKKHECSTCKKSFDRPIHLKVHIRSHTGEKPVKCWHCNKNFSNKQSLTKHMKTAMHLQVTNNGEKVKLEKRFLCYICGATFFRQQSLQRHIEISHVPGDTLKCPHCDYNTRCKHNLKRHLDCHSNIKRYICEICGASFRAFGTLKEHHTFVHSESRSFVCDTCGKAFKNKSTLQRHLRVHREDRPYKCHCNRDYKRLSHLKRHLAVAHQMTAKQSFDKKKIEICDVEKNSNSANTFLEVQQNSAPSNNVLNSQDQNFKPVDLHESLFQNNMDSNYPSLKGSDEENECKYVPYQNIINFLEKIAPEIDTKNPGKGPITPVTYSVVQSNSQDSISLDDRNLNLSPSIYFNFTNLSTSPLKVQPGVPLNDVNRPRSLPNLNFQTSSIEAFAPFSMQNTDLPSTIPPTLLLDREMHTPDLEQSLSSKHLFSDLPNFNSNSESGIVECYSESFFNVPKSIEGWNSSKENSKVISTFENVELAADSYEHSTLSDFSGDLSSCYNPILACNLVFPDDPLMECTIDTDSFNTNEFGLS